MTASSTPPDPAALLAHSGWVRALSRSLVADPSVADEVEQETWRKALESPPRHAGNLRAWLASVVRSVASQRARGESRLQRRHARMQSASDSETGVGPRQAPPETPQQVSERLETFQKLAAAVSELEEPFGSAIYLRFVENLPVKEVAARQGVPLPTAQTRIQRGLELLRNRLQGSLGNDWRARCLVFAMPAPSLASVSVWTGVLAMTTTPKFLAAAAVVVLAIPLYSVLSADSGVEAEGSTSAAYVDDAVVPIMAGQGSPSMSDVPVDREAVEQPKTVSDVDPRAIRVVVRDAETLAEIPHAEVFYFDRASDKDKDWNRDLFSRYTDIETLMERYGDAYKADEQGRAVLPARRSYAYIAARSNGEYAETYLFEDIETSGQTEVELLLRPAVHLTVKVVDAAGQPVANQRVEYQEWWQTDFAQYLNQAMTGENGVTVFRNMQQQFADTRPDHEYRVSVPIPGAVVSHVFDPHSPPSSEVVLRLPETCEMHVLISDEQGNPIANGRPVFMQEWVEGEKLTDVYQTNAKRGGLMTWTQDGKAVFPRVALGAHVLAWIQLPGQREAVRVDGPTPLAAGAIGELVMNGPPDPTTLKLSVFDEAGEPVSDTTLSLQQVVVGDGIQPDAIRSRRGTDAEGGLVLLQDRVLPDAALAPADARMKLLASYVKDSVLRWGLLDWAVVTSPGVNNLPDLALGREAIASGQVVNTAGEPVAFAEMNLQLPAFWPRDETPVWLAFKADESGRFEVRGEGLEAGSDIRVWVSAPARAGDINGGSGAWLDLKVGVPDQRLVLLDSVSIRGRLLLPSKTPTEQLTLSLEVVNHEGETTSEYIQVDRSNGRFERSNLSEGTGTLVLTGSANVELARSIPFDLTVGSTSVPQEWEQLDLRDSVFLHTLQVLDAEGEQVDRFTYIVEEAQRAGVGSRSTNLVLPYNQFTVRVDADGYQPSEAQLVAGEASVVLRDGFDVEFVLPEGVAMPDGQFRLFLRLVEPDGKQSSTDRRWEQASAGEGRWRGAVSYPGRYMLGLASIQKVDRFSENWTEVRLQNGVSFINVEIDGAEGTQRFEIPVTAEALQAAVDAGDQD